MHDYVCFITPIDCCVELIIVDKTFFENCSPCILKWFRPNSFGEMCFLEESYERQFKTPYQPLSVFLNGLVGYKCCQPTIVCSAILSAFVCFVLFVCFFF